VTLDAATRRQTQAAWPGASTWLAANAGSGKTRVLTDRVARLLLDRVPPQNILCLTYTKAAAAEMQNRLFRRLGDWAMRDDARLSADLTRLGLDETPDRARLAEARRLFARAIETPGGLRIQTIHSFCASLLRRFPLEAGVTPNFTEMDDRAAALLRDEVLEDLADGPDRTAFDALVQEYATEDLTGVTQAILRHAEGFSPPADRDAIADWFDLPPGYDIQALLAETFPGGEAALIQRILPVFQQGGVNDRKAAQRLAALAWDPPDSDTLTGAIGLFLTGAGAKTPFAAKIGTLPSKAAQPLLGADLDALNALMARVETARERRNALAATDRAAALHGFAAAFLPAYADRKTRRGWLDFDDLIVKTRALLTDPAVSGWVLYRLDGGLDHILVDEAQDTSPVQWQVIERLAQEFTAGQGARDGVHRTIFVVGDQKQSIYSFQGADPAAFERMRRHFAGKLDAVGEGLQNLELEYSFRSSEAVLGFVETVFRGRVSPDLVLDSPHRAFHDSLPGRVDLWPPVPKTPPAPKQRWTDPVDLPAEDRETVILARRIAETIAQTIATETIPLQDGRRRPIAAGDFLILVRRRSDLFQEIIRACKSRGLPIAGADRLRLGGELAVRDLAALLRFLATPEDDLSLAAALRSPLLGWDEAMLYDLAQPRGAAFLWAALRARAEAHPETLAILNDLRDQADFLRPYDLIERVLIRHDGRRKLLARLGPEAEDGIDSLLSQALAYERTDVPSLTGFLTWLDTDDVEIKRQLDSAGDQIRVMTVHGAKGLESPIVILPDTARRTLRLSDEILALDGGRPVWRLPEAWQPAAMQAALDARKRAQQDEALRLFYVALTRAETWLMIAAAGDLGEAEDSWYRMAETALTTLGAQPCPMPGGAGLRHARHDWTGGDCVTPQAPAPAETALPDWTERRAAIPDRPAAARAPSDLGGDKALPGDRPEREDDPLSFGRQVHLLLQYLPGQDRATWGQRARGVFAGHGLDPAAAEAALAHAEPVLTAPDLAFLFAEDALTEVDLSAALPTLGGDRVRGALDRLLIGPERILAVDFKTNARPPATEAEVPEGILRQMGAYLEALTAIYPDRRVDLALVWTVGPRLMPLSPEILRAALARTGTS